MKLEVFPIRPLRRRRCVRCYVETRCLFRSVISTHFTFLERGSLKQSGEAVQRYYRSVSLTGTALLSAAFSKNDPSDG